jgi:NitT/TauT family transport system ATP-binding protein
MSSGPTNRFPVSIVGLTKRFGSDVTALDNVSLTIDPGEFIALIGPSGCGKTTLLRLLAGLESPTEGSILLDQRTPREACADRSIGVAFQRAALVPTRTALENVALTLEVTNVAQAYDPKRLLRDFGLGDFLHHFPHQLSGGMQQRVNIAAALVHDPAILLLDEPFGALDEMTRHDLIRWLQGILGTAPKTTVLVTHSVEEAVLLADRVVVLSARPGRVHEIVPIPLPRPRPEAEDAVVLAEIQKVRRALHAVLDSETKGVGA